MLLICGFFASFFLSGFSGFAVLCPFCFSGFVSLFLVGGLSLCLVPLVRVAVLFCLVVVVSVSSGVVFVGFLPCVVWFGFLLFLLIVVFLPLVLVSLCFFLFCCCSFFGFFLLCCFCFVSSL